MILKTYARVFTNDYEGTLATFERLHGQKAHLRLKYGDWDLAGIGDVFVVAGTEEALAPIRGSHGPLIVRDIMALHDELLAEGAIITQPVIDVPTGRMLYARHADGLHVEYVEWTDDLIEQFIRAPQREGKLSSEL
ncbi:VOC family protein [Sphingomonas populi]|uniref:VOC family protein n=1 Tax=Sphingomonas populi TaxID=2484750 RepID=A0A4Q6XYD9_9SPHN|nr:VOC family protein [Sphingomonas populi]RZF65215.1 VOC family protein [Sphingomonas populi]